MDSARCAGILNYLAAQSEVTGYSSYVGGKALIVSRNVNRVVNIRGLNFGNISRVSGLSDRIVLGSIDTSGNDGNGIVLGMILADRLGAVVDDTVSVISPAGAEMASMQMGVPIIRRFRISGIYESNNKDYDGYYAFTDLKNSQILFNLNSRVDGIDVRLHNIDETGDIQEKVEKKFGSEVRVQTWYDLHKELYTVMMIERWGAYFILCLIIAVASFNLLGSLTMTVVEKRRDIGILKSMGGTDRSLRKIFALQGLLVGIIGTTAGMIIGLAIVYIQKQYHLYPLDTTIYIISAVPVDVDIMDVIFVAGAAVGLCSVASRLPAKRAANMDPVEAIRWE
jgi:lipoprotein-releasing system permease protein